MSVLRPLRILFASYHCYLDQSSGAAISLRQLLKLLVQRGWQCRVMCGPQLDYEEGKTVAELVDQFGMRYQKRNAYAENRSFVLYDTKLDGVPIVAYETPGAPPQQKLSREQGRTHMAMFDRALAEFQPDILLTYGGQWMAVPCMKRAKERGCGVVFWLRNTAYQRKNIFEHTDGVLVPSDFSRDFYRRTINLETTAIASPVDPSFAYCERINRHFLTFVNPTPVKGVFVFAGIARELYKRRDDIPMLVVEGRSGVRWLQSMKLGASALDKIQFMSNTPDPRTFYARTRALLMPSLWDEVFGRVVVESYLNGIPVLTSNRGGLRDVVGDGGFVFDIPGQYTGKSRFMPTAEDVAPWLETIERLWDDERFYEQACQNAKRNAERWHPERLADKYEWYFREIIRSSGSHVDRFA